MSALSGTQLAYRWLTTPPRRLTRSELDHARAFRRQCAAWIRDRNIVGYALGDKDPAYSGPMREPVLRFNVRRKLPVSRIRHLIPAVITLPTGRRVMTDVAVAPKARTSCGPGGRIYGVQQGSDDAGTASCLVYAIANPSRQYVLSAWHVLCGPNGRTNDPVTCGGKVCATLSSKYESLVLDAQEDPTHLQSFDAALALMTDANAEVGNPALGLAFTGIRQTSVGSGESLTSWGSYSAAAKTGTVMEPAVTAAVDYPGDGFATFANLIKTTLISEKGDSGGPVTDAAGNLVGYVIADDSDTNGHGHWTWIQPIEPILDRYGVSLALGSDDLTPKALSVGVTQPKDQIDILARTLWGEARGEGTRGLLAVCWVVLNRVAAKHPKQFGNTIAEVCQKPKQFSCWNAGDPNREKLLNVTTADAVFRSCLELARQAVNGTIPPDPTNGSRHYHADSIPNPWPDHEPVVRIGSHLFYNDVP